MLICDVFSTTCPTLITRVQYFININAEENILKGGEIVLQMIFTSVGTRRFARVNVGILKLSYIIG